MGLALLLGLGLGDGLAGADFDGAQAGVEALRLPAGEDPAEVALPR